MSATSLGTVLMSSRNTVLSAGFRVTGREQVERIGESRSFIVPSGQRQRQPRRNKPNRLGVANRGSIGDSRPIASWGHPRGPESGLAEAAQTASRTDPRFELASWRLVFRKGAPIAKVAVARKPAIRLYIMLRDGTDYEEFCRRGPDGSRRASHGGMLREVALV